MCKGMIQSMCPTACGEWLDVPDAFRVVFGDCGNKFCSSFDFEYQLPLPRKLIFKFRFRCPTKDCEFHANPFSAVYNIPKEYEIRIIKIWEIMNSHVNIDTMNNDQFNEWYGGSVPYDVLVTADGRPLPHYVSSFTQTHGYGLSTPSNVIATNNEMNGNTVPSNVIQTQDINMMIPDDTHPLLTAEDVEQIEENIQAMPAVGFENFGLNDDAFKMLFGQFDADEDVDMTNALPAIDQAPAPVAEFPAQNADPAPTIDVAAASVDGHSTSVADAGPAPTTGAKHNKAVKPVKTKATKTQATKTKAATKPKATTKPQEAADKPPTAQRLKNKKARTKKQPHESQKDWKDRLEREAKEFLRTHHTKVNMQAVKDVIDDVNGVGEIKNPHKKGVKREKRGLYGEQGKTDLVYMLRVARLPYAHIRRDPRYEKRTNGDLGSAVTRYMP